MDDRVKPMADSRTMHPALAGISLAIFDLDGTLIDSAPDLACALDQALAERDLPPAGIHKVRQWVGDGSRKLIERALADAMAPFDPSRVDSVHTRFLAHYAAASCERTRPYEGARECLDAMRQRDIVCALVTNKPVDFLPAILAQSRLASYFALTLGGDSLAEKKPHPAPLVHVAEQIGIAAQHAVMIGDSRHDVQAGKAAGTRTLAVTYGYNHGDPISASRPDYRVDSLAVLAHGHAGQPADRI